MFNNVKNEAKFEKFNNRLKLAEAQNPQVVPIKAGFTQFEVINAIYDSKILSSIKLTAGARLVLISLARHYNPSNDEFFPSYTCISDHTGVSRKSVERAIKELVAAGLITYRTEKVNRYRFTGRFFACVKMTLDPRQNDACDRGQNDALTNNHEKIINNKNVLNFSFKNVAENGGKTVETPVKSGAADNNFEPDLIQNFSEDLQDNEGGNGARASTDYNKGISNVNKMQSYQGAKNAYNTGFSSYKYANSRTGARYSVPPYERSGGSSFTPSVSSTNKYLKSLRQAREEACSPVDFDYERAKRWYNSLSAPLKSTSLAKQVVAKFPTLAE